MARHTKADGQATCLTFETDEAIKDLIRRLISGMVDDFLSPRGELFPPSEQSRKLLQTQVVRSKLKKGVTRVAGKKKPPVKEHAR
jgi:hypothetical protein